MGVSEFEIAAAGRRVSATRACAALKSDDEDAGRPPETAGKGISVRTADANLDGEGAAEAKGDGAGGVDLGTVAGD